jgi:elongation factor Ts
VDVLTTTTATGSPADTTQEEIGLLRDVDPAVRMRSAMALGQRRAVEAAGALVDRLGLEREFFIRETLTWAILRMGHEAQPFLDEALASPRWLARRQAAHALSKLGRREDAARLLPLIADEEDAVASRAYAAAAGTGCPSVVAPLVGQLSRGDAEHQATLTAALASLGGLAVPALVEALRDGLHPDIRRHAADALAFLGSPEVDRAVLPLTEALQDPQEPVRLAALNALGNLHLPAADAAVDRATRSGDPALRCLAVRLAARLAQRTAVPAGPPKTLTTTRDRAAPSSAARLASLRKRTGAGVMRCKAALEQADGDEDEALHLLLRPTTSPDAGCGLPSGIVAAAPGTLVALSCETDIVAGSRAFRALAQRVADIAATRAQAGPEELAGAGCDGGRLADALAEMSSASGERIGITEVVRLPGRTTAHLRAAIPCGPPRVGALVSYRGGEGGEEIAHRVAVQVAACAPRYLARQDIPEDVLAAARALAERAVRERALSGTIARRVIAGHVEDAVHEMALLEQVSIVDPGRTISGLLYGTGVHITGFARLEVGAGRS